MWCQNEYNPNKTPKQLRPFALMGTIVAAVCLYIIGRQIYLIWGGSQTVVELSRETIHPGQTIFGE